MFYFSGSRKTAVLSGYVILVLAGVCTNLIVSAVIVSNSRLRVARNLFIVNLSISDLMLCIFCMPFTLVELLTRTWSLGSFLCRGVPFVQGVTIFLSSATVSAIAIDRQQVIINFSGNRKKMDKGKSNMIVYTTILWCFSIMMALPIIFSKSVTTVSLAGMVLRTVRYTKHRADSHPPANQVLSQQECSEARCQEFATYFRAPEERAEEKQPCHRGIVLHIHCFRMQLASVECLQHHGRFRPTVQTPLSTSTWLLWYATWLLCPPASPIPSCTDGSTAMFEER
ncbi:neuropeptide F receptor [Trichonephila inaurata madagascariensis]|uniref:Neuropeptide F receptor n=1 Tax=Trichonephila inaurata madagascariensis TaxID=2747483 RepID=A0A8X7C6A7_9ARAC|nr:neuropeptide F receptor [Trichonephila inaurata madagascariensis]